MNLSHIKLAQKLVETKAPPKGLPFGTAPAALVYGVVTAIAAGPPASLTITLAGSSTSIAGVRYLSSYGPVVNDTVEILQSGSDLLVIGTLAAGKPNSPFIWFGDGAPNTVITNGSTSQNTSVYTVTLPVAMRLTTDLTVEASYAPTQALTIYITVDGTKFNAVVSYGNTTITFPDSYTVDLAAGAHTIGYRLEVGGGGSSVTFNAFHLKSIAGIVGP